MIVHLLESDRFLDVGRDMLDGPLVPDFLAGAGVDIPDVDYEFSPLVVFDHFGYLARSHILDHSAPSESPIAL